jgi:hypothetical protein
MTTMSLAKGVEQASTNVKKSLPQNKSVFWGSWIFWHQWLNIMWNLEVQAQ